MQKIKSAAGFEPSTLLCRKKPLRLNSNPPTLASIEALRLDSNPPTLASIEALRLDSNPLPYDAEKKTLLLNSNPPTYFQTL
jgi:hypothetical protein